MQISLTSSQALSPITAWAGSPKSGGAMEGDEARNAVAGGTFAARLFCTNAPAWTAMPYYQLYYMNPVSGHIDRQETLHAGDDVAAVHLLQGLRPKGPVELWREGRKISRQDGPPSPFRNRALSREAG
jgi:hypothetical protein